MPPGPAETHSVEPIMTTVRNARRSAGQVSGPMVAGLVVAVIVVLAAIYFLWPSPEPEAVPAPAPAPTTPLETVAPAKTEEERGDSAREVIASLRADPAGVDYDQAHRRALEFHAGGRAADAQLLLFFAARGGYGPAAFDLATMYDPNHFETGASLMDEPDATQAYKWYLAARDSGQPAADGRLTELKAWTESAAAAGNPDAERLLLQWEQN